jgi:hypothetical protein
MAEEAFSFLSTDPLACTDNFGVTRVARRGHDLDTITFVTFGLFLRHSACSGDPISISLLAVFDM